MQNSKTTTHFRNPGQLLEYIAGIDKTVPRIQTPGSAYKPQADDLFALYLLVLRQRPAAVMEIGSGWSTLVLALALEESLTDWTLEDLRHPNKGEILSVDSSSEFSRLSISRCGQAGLAKVHVRPHVSRSIAGTFNDQVCHYFESLPIFSANLIYLDGPDSSQVEGDVRGFSSKGRDQFSSYGLPMSADILAIENFLWPGTVMVVDGRGANAEFLKTNLRRPWEYRYFKFTDQHYFHLKSDSWGRHSEKLIERSLDFSLDSFENELKTIILT